MFYVINYSIQLHFKVINYRAITNFNYFFSYMKALRIQTLNPISDSIIKFVVKAFVFAYTFNPYYSSVTARKDSGKGGQSVNISTFRPHNF